MRIKTFEFLYFSHQYLLCSIFKIPLPRQRQLCCPFKQPVGTMWSSPLAPFGTSWILLLHHQCPSFAALFKQPVGTSGLEPPTSRLSGVRSNHLSYAPIQWPSVLSSLPLCSRSPFFRKTSGGDEEVRTPDPLRAKQVLSQLSYTPICIGFSSHP